MSGTKVLFAVYLLTVALLQRPPEAGANGSDSFINFKPGVREIKGKFTVYDLPRDYAVPHCLTSDHQGNIWFTEIGANRVGKFDPEKREFTE